MAEPIVTHPTDEALHAHRARLDQCECPYCVPPDREPLSLGAVLPDVLKEMRRIQDERAKQCQPPDMLVAAPPYSQFTRERYGR